MPALVASRRALLGGQTFDPRQLSGLQLWLDAIKQPLADGTAVSSWTDQSGNGRNATQATGANQPLWKQNGINGRPALLFDGTDDMLLSAAGVSAPFTVFCVYDLVANPAAWEAISRGNTNDNVFHFGLINGELGTAVGTQTAWTNTTAWQATQAATGQGHVFGASHDGGSNLYGYLDSAQSFTPLAGAMTSCPSIGIGGEPITLNGYTNMYLAAYLHWNRVLSAGELAALVGYLRRRHGI